MTGPSAASLLRAHVSERDFQQQVTDLASLHGWLIYHTHDSRRSQPGFPDLVLVRERVIFAELKTERGKLTRAQRIWLAALAGASVEAYCWRPSDTDTIAAILARKTPPKSQDASTSDMR